ncbi:MAG: aspartate/methionine/tyrosine aminotransferase, partial [Planctomycetota bacterium]
DVFIEAAVEKKVLIVPGKAFSSHDTHFRLSFAASDEHLAAGIAVLNELADRFAS